MSSELMDVPPRKSPDTWNLSRWSSLGWGCHSKNILPCFPERCRYIDRLRCECPPGDGRRCSWETDLFAYYLNGYHRQFHPARQVLGDTQYLDRLRQLSFLEVRLYRIKMRSNWLDLHRDEALKDEEWFKAEVDRTYAYQRTARNHWLRIREELETAALPPMHGLPDIFRVEWIKHRIEVGVGPVCDLRTREVTFDSVWENYHENLYRRRWEKVLYRNAFMNNRDESADEDDPYVAYFEDLRQKDEDD